MRPPSERQRTPRKPPAVDAASLQEAALRYLARYAATQAGLARVLQRRVDNWARAVEADPDQVAAIRARARAEIAAIVGRLAQSGAVDDAAFAAARARSLARAGRSRRAIGAHLATRGVPSETAHGALPDSPDQELAAALIHARKRRLGPWRRAEASPEQVRRELASFARGGFVQSVARTVLAMDAEAGEAAIIAFRAGL